MWRIVQHDVGDDFVLATGETHTVRSFVEAAFKAVDIGVEWKGTGVDEKGYEVGTGKVLIEVDPAYFRPTEVELLIGNPTKAREKLGWTYTTTLSEMVSEMVASDLAVVKLEKDRKDRHG
jgi:GDPmannose 4,6-dehydratase